MRSSVPCSSSYVDVGYVNTDRPSKKNGNQFDVLPRLYAYEDLMLYDKETITPEPSYIKLTS